MIESAAAITMIKSPSVEKDTIDKSPPVESLSPQCK